MTEWSVKKACFAAPALCVGAKSQDF